MIKYTAKNSENVQEGEILAKDERRNENVFYIEIMCFSVFATQMTMPRCGRAREAAAVAPLDMSGFLRGGRNFFPCRQALCENQLAPTYCFLNFRVLYLGSQSSPEKEWYRSTQIGETKC